MNAIEISGLNWKYSGKDQPALKDINLSICENTFVGIIGSNESGKTTLVSCIKGLIPENYSGVYKGEVKLFGKSIKECSTVDIARTVGMVFSDPDAQFTSMSVEEEIAFGLENMGLPVSEIKERIEWVSRLTSIESLLEKPPYDLSGGQKQRIAIASIIAMKPRIIILDEPTSMLDPFAKDNIFSLLQTMKRELKVTIIVVEHNIEKIAELADQIILVSDGRVEKIGESQGFFDDIEFIESHSVKVPEAIKFIQRLYKEKGLCGSAPVRFDEIKKAAEELLGK
ncbi:energy-coupling factor transport system ATP-binding protein [Anaerobacterium chartisolvens]|uniref:Energy-coupling factor transport system ATP-binding protein n=1 Tax=Anaerobacterium chartisolvens TaxID=1297424 RepID=A0A369AMS5_9FIRM|nr:ATP-binding cassette domain-containing protein [Anaerobacterium chartisolvens]RCX09576.1 energy-coupling factor transport system ATP-binding protein [Anaerobacterium chartisolvens]